MFIFFSVLPASNRTSIAIYVPVLPIPALANYIKKTNKSKKKSEVVSNSGLNFTDLVQIEVKSTAYFYFNSRHYV